MKPTLTIEYCPRCHWLPRAAWMAQELLYTFEEEISGITLQPSEEGGVYRLFADGKRIYDRKEYGGFPEIKVLKQWVRDKIHPDMDLGHSDR